MFYRIAHPGESPIVMTDRAHTAFPTLRELRDLWPATLIGTIVGLIVGVMPGAGATASSFVAYNEARRWSKRPELFGKGSMEGVAAPETANNAVQGGDLVPTLALGIPGSNSAAIMLARSSCTASSRGRSCSRSTPSSSTRCSPGCSSSIS